MNVSVTPRRRLLERLAAIAAGLSVIALAVAIGQAPRPHRETAPTPYFAEPAFPDALAQLEVISAIERYSIVRFGDGFLFENTNQSIPGDEIAALMEALNSWKRIGMRTARPGMLDRLNLGAPEEGGAGIRLRITKRDGQIRDVILGTMAKEEGFYVRGAESTQSWLVTGQRPSNLRSIDWAKRFAFDWEAASIIRVRISPPDQPPFTFERSDTGWLVSEGSPGLATPERFAETLSALSFIDVMASADLLSAPVALYEAQRRDGLSVTLALYQENGREWIIVAAAAATEAAEQAAEAVRAGVQGQAFAIQPQDRARLFP
jgi:hypothetical protein